jgi:hypothetical protein
VLEFSTFRDHRIWKERHRSFHQLSFDVEEGWERVGDR